MLVIYLCGVLLMFGERLLMYWLTPKLYGQVVLPGIFNRNNSIVCLAATVAIFLVFRNLRIQNRFLQKIIMIAAPLSFAVYLIHDNNTMRYALWAMLKPFSMAHSPWMLLHLILCVSGIFAVCCAIEWLRQLLFRKLKIDKGIEKASQRITARTQKLLDKSIHTAQTDT